MYKTNTSVQGRNANLSERFPSSVRFVSSCGSNIVIDRQEAELQLAVDKTRKASLPLCVRCLSPSD